MTNVHAHATRSTSGATTVRSRRTKPAPITCSGCAGRNNCTCLTELRLLRLMAPLVRQLLTGGTDLVKRRQVRAQLAELADQDEQRLREVRLIYGTAHTETDRDVLDDLASDWGYESDFSRTVEGIAERRNVSVGRVRALFARLLRASAARVAIPASSTASRRAA